MSISIPKTILNFKKQTSISIKIQKKVKPKPILKTTSQIVLKNSKIIIVPIILILKFTNEALIEINFLKPP